MSERYSTDCADISSSDAREFALGATSNRNEETVMFKLSNAHSLDLATAKEAGRSSLDCAHLESGRVVATDGKVLAVLPLEGIPEGTNAFIPRKALAFARKGPKGAEATFSFDADTDRVTVQRGDVSATFDSAMYAEYPRVDSVIPALDSDHSLSGFVDAIRSAKTADDAIPILAQILEDTPKRVGLDPVLLSNLVEAIGAGKRADKPGVILTVRDRFSPVRVDTTSDGSGPFGVIMPITMEA